ncbi:mCG147175 [Mus musculus]|nr:mCG147175 [Mus musculus]
MKTRDLATDRTHFVVVVVWLVGWFWFFLHPQGLEAIPSPRI